MPGATTGVWASVSFGPWWMEISWLRVGAVPAWETCRVAVDADATAPDELAAETATTVASVARPARSGTRRRLENSTDMRDPLRGGADAVIPALELPHAEQVLFLRYPATPG